MESQTGWANRKWAGGHPTDNAYKYFKQTVGRTGGHTRQARHTRQTEKRADRTNTHMDGDKWAVVKIILESCKRDREL